MIKGFNRPFKWYFLPRKRPKSTIAISLDLTFLSSELDFPPNFLFLHVADLKDNYSDGNGSGSNHLGGREDSIDDRLPAQNSIEVTSHSTRYCPKPKRIRKCTK